MGPGLVIVDAPDLEDSIFATSGQIMPTRTELDSPDRLLVSSDILNQVKAGLGILLPLVEPGVDFLMEKVHILAVQLLHQKWVIVAQSLSLLHLHFVQPERYF